MDKKLAVIIFFLVLNIVACVAVLSEAVISNFQPELKIPLEQPCDGPPVGFDITSKPDICETDMRET